MPETDRCDGTQPVDIRDKTLVVLGSVGHSKPGLFRAAARRGVRLVLVKEHATWEKDYCVDVLPINCSTLSVRCIASAHSPALRPAYLPSIFSTMKMRMAPPIPPPKSR